MEQAYGQPKKEEQLRKDIEYSKVSLADAEQRIQNESKQKDVTKDIKISPDNLKELYALIQKGLDTKFVVDKSYKDANPELSEGATVGLEKPSEESEVPLEKTEGVEPA